MTVANIILEKHRGRLISDTVGYLGKEPAMLESKIRLLEGPGVAMIVRGRVTLALDLEAVAETCTSFAAVLSSLKAEIERTPAEYFPGSGAEVTVLGMDEGEARCSRIWVTKNGGLLTVQRVDLERGVYLAPTLGQHSLPTSMSDEQAFKVALMQQGIAIKHTLNICIGGDVEIATVDASGMAVRKVGEYPNKSETVARIAALNGSDLDDVAA